MIKHPLKALIIHRPLGLCFVCTQRGDTKHMNNKLAILAVTGLILVAVGVGTRSLIRGAVRTIQGLLEIHP